MKHLKTNITPLVCFQAKPLRSCHWSTRSTRVRSPLGSGRLWDALGLEIGIWGMGHWTLVENVTPTSFTSSVTYSWRFQSHGSIACSIGKIDVKWKVEALFHKWPSASRTWLYQYCSCDVGWNQPTACGLYLTSLACWFYQIQSDQTRELFLVRLQTVSCGWRIGRRKGFASEHLSCQQSLWKDTNHLSGQRTWNKSKKNI